MMRAALIALSCVLVALVFAWSAWPARHAAAHTLRVAAIQGNISQDVKWTRAAFETARARYAFLTTAAARAHPALILWPETVMTLDLNLAPEVVHGISSLARASHATLMVGAKQSTPQGEYNALYVFTGDGRLSSVYRKRRLVPFVETLPAPWLFGRIPVAAFISRFRPGETSGVVPIDGLPIAPLICWESAFDGEAHAAMRDGARAFALSTDDAWFGSTAGPYQHAQIAQMRALENGVWVLRAAATGISGIIAPSGRYVTRAPLNTMRVVAGAIGPPQLTPYARLGPVPVAVALIVLYAALVLRPRRAP